MRAQREDTTLKYILQDHLGGTSKTASSAGAVTGTICYFSFGSTRSGSVSTDIKFTGQRQDSHGLYYYGARYYDPEIGRFISADTIVPNPMNPQSLNRYSYCLNNPLRYVDPSGQTYEEYIHIYGGQVGGGGNGGDGGSGGKGGGGDDYDVIGSVGSDWSYESLVNELSKYNYASWPLFKKSTEEIFNEFQTALDMCGMVPGFGEPFDAVNALIYIGRGDLVAAAFSIGAIVPVAGATSTVLKWGYKAGDVPAQLLRGRQFEKTVLSELGLTKNTAKIGNHIPDNIIGSTITEIKDVKYLYNNAQLRGFSNLKLNLVVSPQTKVSQPLYDAVYASGGKIRVRESSGVYTEYMPWWK